MPLPSTYLRGGSGSCNTARVLGVRHGDRSGAVNAALIDFGSDHSFDEAAEIFKRHYKFKISDSTIRRTTERAGTAAEQFVKNKLEEYERADEAGKPQVPPLDKLSIEADGCTIRTGTLEVITPSTAPAEGSMETTCLTTPSGRPKCKRNEEWRDVRLGFVQKMGQEDVEKWFVGGMIDLPTLTKNLFKLGLGLGMNENTKPVATADGGNGLYEELDRAFCNLQFILDYYHFKEHLYDTAKELGLQGDVKEKWVQSKADLAWNGCINELLKNLESEYVACDNDRVRRLIGYITRFKTCINYKEFHESGYSIGSGAIESAHKSVTQKRLKLPGACWRPENVNPMLTLRILKQNNWWGDFMNNQYLAEAA